MSAASKTAVRQRKKTAPKATGKAKKATKKSVAKKTGAKTSTKKATKKASAKKPAKVAAKARPAASKAAKGAKATSKKAAAKPAAAKAAPKKVAAKAAPKKVAAKAPAEAKPKAKPEPKKRKISPKNRLAAVFEKLDRIFGAIVPPSDTDTIIEKAVYLVLRETGTEPTTARAMKALREEFVDWNEVRLSRPSEMARLMTNSVKSATIKRFVERCRRIGEMLDQIYNDRNEVSLEFLLEEKPKAQVEYLEDLDDLGIHNSYALVQWLSGDEKLCLVSPEMAEVSQTLGLTESAAMAKVKKELTALTGKDKLIQIQAHLNQLGDMERDEWPGALKELL
jgi:endonuclease III